MTEQRLSVRGLNIDYPCSRVVNNMNFTLGNERLALVGESGSGKSMTARALMGLVRKPGIVSADQLNVLGRDVQSLDARGWRALRGNDIAMVLQDPRYALNPVKTVRAQLEEALGDRFLLITQNIDNLHERAGNRNIIHMHGELLKVRCAWSGQVLDWKEDVLPEDKCHCCQFPARLRPHVVWFGEMPLGMDEIYMALAMADVFIAIGTSGHVYPAAGFVHEARLHGAHTVELNLEPSQVGSEFEEKYYGPASQVVPEFVEKLLKGL
mgnify:CR=1 FL=1